MHVKKTELSCEPQSERTMDTYAGALELEDQDEIEIEPSIQQRKNKKSNQNYTL